MTCTPLCQNLWQWSWQLLSRSMPTRKKLRRGRSFAKRRLQLSLEILDPCLTFPSLLPSRISSPDLRLHPNQNATARIWQKRGSNIVHFAYMFFLKFYFSQEESYNWYCSSFQFSARIMEGNKTLGSIQSRRRWRSSEITTTAGREQDTSRVGGYLRSVWYSSPN